MTTFRKQFQISSDLTSSLVRLQSGSPTSCLLFLVTGVCTIIPGAEIRDRMQFQEQLSIRFAIMILLKGLSVLFLFEAFSSPQQA